MHDTRIRVVLRPGTHVSHPRGEACDGQQVHVSDLRCRAHTHQAPPVKSLQAPPDTAHVAFSQGFWLQEYLQEVGQFASRSDVKKKSATTILQAKPVDIR